jgi:hypothetical protein
MKKPTVEYATLINSEISGPIRCESLDGTEIWLPPQSGKITILPFQQNGKWFGVSHIQKKSKHFRLNFHPFSYHFGEFWKLQEYETLSDGSTYWKPGTEKGIYFRLPGWRWQLPDAVSDWTPWVWTWGRAPGMHLD